MEHYKVSTLLPLYNQQEEWAYRMRMVREARQFLYASTYFLQYDKYGHDYINALIKISLRGASVNLLIDGFGQKLASNLMSRNEIRGLKAALQKLEEAGGKVMFYRGRNRLQRLLGSGMHIKIQVSEAGNALFASGNISHTSYDKWKEFSVGVKGTIVQRLLAEFSALGMNVDEEHLQQLQTSADGEDIGYISYNPVLDRHRFNPLDLKDPNPISDYLLQVFNAVKSSISLTSFYFKPEPRLVYALVRAARRGVKVEIFHSHPDALGPTIAPWLPSFHLYRELLDAGVIIYENLKGEHSKIIVADNKLVIFGSYNLEYAAHDRLAEAMMISSGETMLNTAEQIFTQLRTHSDNTKVNNSFAQLTAGRRWKTRLAKPFTRWL